MDQRYYMLTNTILYNEKSLRVVDSNEKIDTFILLTEDIEVVDDVAQLYQGILTILL
jgi:hypothetical protein